MTINVNIKDPKSSVLSKVTKNNALTIAEIDGELPPISKPNRKSIFIRKLDTVGDGTGSNNQGVDGSSTNQHFFLNAGSNNDIHMISAEIVIKDSSISHDKFGALNALTNGWDLKIRESGVETTLMDAVKTGGDLILQSGLFNPFGTGSELNEIPVTGVSEGAQVATFDFGKLVPEGLRLGRTSLDRIESIVKDDLTGLIDFYVLCMGYEHIPVE